MSFLNRKPSQGFSLIELMIAMVLGLVLMGGVIQVFLTSKQSYAFNEELGWIQENSRFAIEFITRDVRMAGYWGCNTDVEVVNTLKPVSGTGWQIDFNNSLGGFDGDDTGNAAFTGSPSEFPQPTPPTVTSGSIPRSDVLTLSRLDNNNSFNVSSHNTSSANITIGAHPFESGDILVISDCEQSAIFQHTGSNPIKVVHNTGNSTTPGNCTKKLGSPGIGGDPCVSATAKEYGDDAFVMAAVSFAYYVGIATNGLPALYVKELGNDAGTSSSELVQGIENLQVLYGEDITGDGFPNRYVNAKDVTTWTDVTTARIHILARSLTQSASEPQTFNFVGTSYTPTDRFLRQEFVSTVKVRNRG